MDDKTKLASIILIFVAGLTLALDLLTLNIVFLIGVLFFVGAVIFLSYRKDALQSLTDTFKEDQGLFNNGGQEGFTDIDEMWDGVQNWYRKDPKNGEIIWKQGITKFTTAAPGSGDGELRFVAVVTPSKELEQNVFFCVEMSTQSLVEWDEKGEINRKDMFGNVDIVEDLRKRSNISAQNMKDQIMNQRIAALGSGGGTGINMNSVNQPRDEIDVKYDNEEGADED